MIATKESFEPSTLRSGPATEDGHSSEQLPGGKKVFVEGRIHAGIRVPMREIEVSPTKSYTGAVEANAPVRVYDCSGPWGDPDFKGTVEEGLPALRREWILKRGDVDEYAGRPAQTIDDGYLSEQHRGLAQAKHQDETPFHLRKTALPKRKILRAKPGKVVTQLAYARAGIITPEMEFIAIRENMGISNLKSQISNLTGDNVRNDLNKQHAGSSQISNLKSQIADYTPSVFRRFPQRIPKEITPEFVRSEVA
ncbi:MAG: phosphomethylpyrimidine synthase, partial [Verrucomicrobiota bacterium]